jgi:hypothetical protein
MSEETELKTLKDLQLCMETFDEKSAKEKLRKEAIKWVKVADKCGCDKCRHTRFTFMDFFNLTQQELTEEDLK